MKQKKRLSTIGLLITSIYFTQRYCSSDKTNTLVDPSVEPSFADSQDLRISGSKGKNLTHFTPFSNSGLNDLLGAQNSDELTSFYRDEFSKKSTLYCNESFDSSGVFCEEMSDYYFEARFACEEEEDASKASMLIKEAGIYYLTQKNNYDSSAPEIPEGWICSSSGLLEILPTSSIDTWLSLQ